MFRTRQSYQERTYYRKKETNEKPKEPRALNSFDNNEAPSAYGFQPAIKFHRDFHLLVPVQAVENVPVRYFCCFRRYRNACMAKMKLARLIGLVRLALVKVGKTFIRPLANFTEFGYGLRNHRPVAIYSIQRRCGWKFSIFRF